MEAGGFHVNRYNAKPISFCLPQLLEASVLELFTTVGFQITTVVHICREEIAVPYGNHANIITKNTGVFYVFIFLTKTS